MSWLAAVLASVKHQIDMALFVFSAQQLADVLEERALPGVDAGDATTARVLVPVLVGPVVFVHLRVGVDVLAFDGSLLIALIRVLVDILVAFVVGDTLSFVFVVRVRR